MTSFESGMQIKWTTIGCKQYFFFLFRKLTRCFILLLHPTSCPASSAVCCFMLEHLAKAEVVAYLTVLQCSRRNCTLTRIKTYMVEFRFHLPARAEYGTKAMSLIILGTWEAKIRIEIRLIARPWHPLAPPTPPPSARRTSPPHSFSQYITV